jgi:MFS family permease
VGFRKGPHAGILAATFCGAQFFTAAIWGKISDKYGRKPAVCIGILGTSLGMFVLGLSKTYEFAILGRAISGILSGNLVIIITPHIIKSTSYVSLV